MKGIYRELRRLRREVCVNRDAINAVMCEVRSLRDQKTDRVITSMQSSVREMLRISRGL